MLGVRVQQNGPRVVNISVFQFIYYTQYYGVFAAAETHNKLVIIIIDRTLLLWSGLARSRKYNIYVFSSVVYRPACRSNGTMAIRMCDAENRVRRRLYYEFVHDDIITRAHIKVRIILYYPSTYGNVSVRVQQDILYYIIQYKLLLSPLSSS